MTKGNSCSSGDKGDMSDPLTTVWRRKDGRVERHHRRPVFVFSDVHCLQFTDQRYVSIYASIYVKTATARPFVAMYYIIMSFFDPLGGSRLGVHTVPL